MVVLIRAWKDDDAVRGRITLEGDDGEVETLTASSLEDLCSLVCRAIEHWADRR